jgi:hypothetical protein
MSAIYSGAFWNSAQPPEANAFTRRHSRNDTSCNRWHLDGSSNEKRASVPEPIFVLSSFFSVFARRDGGEQHDPRGRLSGSILTEGGLERQFSVSDLG